MRRSGSPVVLSFAAQIDGVNYPAAIFKLALHYACCWAWLYPSDGTWVALKPQHAVLLKIKENHFTYPRDGRHHQTIRTRNDAITRLPINSRPLLSTLSKWTSLRSIPVPLDSQFQAIGGSLWESVKYPILLDRNDFGKQTSGADLHSFICPSGQVDNLLQRWKQVTSRYWIAGNKQLKLVVIAESIV